MDIGRFNSTGVSLADHEEAMAEVHQMFEYHPWNDQQNAAGKVVRESLEKAACAIISVVPPGPDRSVALRKIREARMDANSAITHNGKY